MGISHVGMHRCSAVHERRVLVGTAEDTADCRLALHSVSPIAHVSQVVTCATLHLSSLITIASAVATRQGCSTEGHVLHHSYQPTSTSLASLSLFTRFTLFLLSFLLHLAPNMQSAPTLLFLLLVFFCYLLPFCQGSSQCSSPVHSACAWESCYSDEDCVACTVDQWGSAVYNCQPKAAAGTSLSGFALFGVIAGCLVALFICTSALRVWRMNKRRWMQQQQQLMRIQPVQAVQMTALPSLTPAPMMMMYPPPAGQTGPGTCWVLQPVPGQVGGQAQGQWVQVAPPNPPPYTGTPYNVSSATTAPPAYVATEGVQRAPQAGVLWTEEAVEKPQGDMVAARV